MSYTNDKVENKISHLEGLYIKNDHQLLSLVKSSVSLPPKGYILEWRRKIRKRRLIQIIHCCKITVIVSPLYTQSLHTALYGSCYKTYQGNK